MRRMCTMRSGGWAFYAAAVALVLVSAAFPAHAIAQDLLVTQDPVVTSARVVAPDPVVAPDLVVATDPVVTAPPVATFSAISDAVPAKFFDAATSAPDAADPNRLIIGFDMGIDFRTFTGNDFRASAFPFSHRVAMDTISFTIDAPSGFYISKVTYTQRGTGFNGRAAVSGGAATWVVAGVPAALGVFMNNPNLVGTADLSALRTTTVPVSITVSLFASTGAVAVTSADVLVELLPLEPPVVP
jgi:hypothetical protein